MLNRLVIFLVLVLFQGQAVSNSQTLNPVKAKAWAEGFLLGYMSGSESTDKLFCPLVDRAKLIQELQMIRNRGYSDVAVLDVQSFGAGSAFEISVPVVLMGETRAKQLLRVTMAERGMAYCIKSAAFIRGADEINNKKKIESVFGGGGL